MSTHLERERDALRTQRVRARENIKHAWHRIADPIDRLRFVEMSQMVLRGTERRWQELQAILGPRRPPVSLKPQPAVKATRPNYITKGQPATKRSSGLFGPIDFTAPVEFHGSTVIIREKDSVPYMAASEYWAEHKKARSHG